VEVKSSDLAIQIYPDRTAELILPTTATDGARSISPARLRRLCSELARREICLVTMYVPVEDTETQASAVAAGFHRTHDLLVLTCSTKMGQAPDVHTPEPVPFAAFPKTGQAPGIHASEPVPFSVGDWRFRPYASTEHAALQAIFARTLIDSLDFPELRSTATVSSVLARFAEAGATGSRWWYLVEHRGNPAGCLLMTDHPNLDRCELLYMGLAPECRGTGGGRMLVQYALWSACHIGRGVVVAGVDAENDPAITVYAAAGFDPSVRRRVFFRELAAGGAVSPCPG
jgi:GNAT superfamily N-acetyltransferase